jgi:hypothetical protein
MAKEAKEAKQLPRGGEFFRFPRLFRMANGDSAMSRARRWGDLAEAMASDDSEPGRLPLDLAGLMQPAWMKEAACRGGGVVDDFYAPRSDVEARARAVALCSSCGPREECLAYAMRFPNDSYGIWGGATPGERARIRRGRQGEAA